MQMYGKFEGFPINRAIFWVGNIKLDVFLAQEAPGMNSITVWTWRGFPPSIDSWNNGSSKQPLHLLQIYLNNPHKHLTWAQTAAQMWMYKFFLKVFFC